MRNMGFGRVARTREIGIWRHGNGREDNTSICCAKVERIGGCPRLGFIEPGYWGCLSRFALPHYCERESLGLSRKTTNYSWASLWDLHKITIAIVGASINARHRKLR